MEFGRGLYGVIMGYVAYFQQGNRKLNLAASPYALDDFMPPAIQEAVNIADGTSANQYGGSTMVDKRVISSSYSFSVRVSGTSSGAISNAIQRIDGFLRSGTKADPVYFCWKPDSNVSAEPLYGQWGAVKRSKVVNGNVYRSARWYLEGEARSSVLFVDVSLLINAPEGKRQKAAQAKGYMVDHDYATVDGRSRGFKPMLAKTNLFNNPIAGHATFDTAWTTAANLTVAKNTDPEFCLRGTSSFKIRANADSANTFTESLPTVVSSTYCVRVYIKRPDGSAPTNSICQIYGTGAAQTTSFRAVGNNWYLAWAVFVSSANPSACGLEVYNGYTVYADGFQAENTGYPTPLVVGDYLGCSWAGTIHNSDSTAAAQWLRLQCEASVINDATGTICVTWLADVTSGHGTNLSLFDHSSTGELNAYYDVGDGRFEFRVGGTTINSSAQTFSRGTIMTLHFTWNNTALKIYRDGTEIATGSTGGPPEVSGSVLYIGNDDTLAEPAWGTILGFTVYGQVLTATEVAADAANILALAQSGDGFGQAVDPPLYFWTKDGDSIVDNCDDSTRDNWGVVSGVVGTLPAVTEYTITPSNGYLTSYLALSPVETFYDPTRQNYYDAQGTGDAGCSGGEYLNLSSSYGYALYTPVNQKEFTGRVHFLARTKHGTGPNFLNGAITYTDSLTAAIISARTDFLTCAQDTTFNLYYMGHINWQYDNSALTNVRAAVEHSSGAEQLDYFMAIPGYLAVINDPLGTGYYSIRGQRIVSSVAGFLAITMTGDVLEVEPQKYNMIWYLQGTNTDTSTITHAATFAVYVTPRWALA